jgi:hypothetical protein
MREAFDDLSKAIAAGVSRREALRRFGVAAIGLAFGGLFAGRAGAKVPSEHDLKDCEKFCNWLYGKNTEQVKQCIKDSRHHKGACYQFGPESDACEHVVCPPHTFCMASNFNDTPGSTQAKDNATCVPC